MKKVIMQKFISFQVLCYHGVVQTYSNQNVSRKGKGIKLAWRGKTGLVQATPPGRMWPRLFYTTGVIWPRPEYTWVYSRGLSDLLHCGTSYLCNTTRVTYKGVLQP